MYHPNLRSKFCSGHRQRNARWALCLLASLLLAGMADPPAALGAKDGATSSSKLADTPAEPSRYAFKLGEFRLKNFRPVEREKVTLEFTVYVEIDAAQQQRFKHVWQYREHRVRNQIITSARLVPPNEFDDPALQALRRRIYLRLRRAVPELPLGEVFVSDFSYIVE
jgi:hypothetical protein